MRCLAATAAEDGQATEAEQCQRAGLGDGGCGVAVELEDRVVLGERDAVDIDVGTLFSELGNGGQRKLRAENKVHENSVVGTLGVDRVTTAAEGDTTRTIDIQHNATAHELEIHVAAIEQMSGQIGVALANGKG